MFPSIILHSSLKRSTRQRATEYHRSAASVSLWIQALHIGGAVRAGQAQSGRDDAPAQGDVVWAQGLQCVHTHWQIADQFIAFLDAETVADLVNRAIALDLHYFNNKGTCLFRHNIYLVDLVRKVRLLPNHSLVPSLPCFPELLRTTFCGGSLAQLPYNAFRIFSKNKGIMSRQDYVGLIANPFHSLIALINV